MRLLKKVALPRIFLSCERHWAKALAASNSLRLSPSAATASLVLSKQ